MAVSTDAETLRAFLAAYDQGWTDCLKSLKAIPANMLPTVIDELLKKGASEK